MNVILEAKDIVKTYGYEDNKVYATNHIDLQIEEGSFVAIVGRSGSGKKNGFCLSILQSYFHTKCFREYSFTNSFR